MWQNGTLRGRFTQIFSSTSLRLKKSIINLVNKAINQIGIIVAEKLLR